MKKKVEEDYKAGGGRNAVQVFANGFVPTMIALVFESGAARLGLPSAVGERQDLATCVLWRRHVGERVGRLVEE